MTLRTITGQASLLITLAVLLVGKSETAFAEREASELTLLPSATVIVAPKDIHHVAALLKELLRKASRTDEGFTILDEIPPAETGDRVVIVLGDTPFAEDIDMGGVRTMGYRIVRRDNVIVIRGIDRHGTLYGTSRFLDQFCGVRAYLPTDLFVSMPDKPEIAVGEIDLISNPSVWALNATGCGSNVGGDEIDLFQKLNAYPRPGKWQYRSHNLPTLLDIAALTQTHPEIFPIHNGKRFLPQDPTRMTRGWQFCFSEPTVADVVMEGIVAHFRRDPQLENVGFNVNDSGGYCQCERCTAKVQAAGDPLIAYSEMYIALVRKLAERMKQELPRHGIATEKTLTYIAYSLVRLAPKEKLPDNVMPVLVYKMSDIVIDGVFDAPKPDAKYADYYQDGLNGLQRWKQRTGIMGHHEWAQGRGYFIPKIYTPLVQRTLKEMEGRYRFMHLESYPNWGLDGPKLYLMARLLWNPDANIDALRRQFCDDMFGEASDPMHDYFSTLETFWNQLNGKMERKFIQRRAYRTQFTADEEDLAVYRRLRGYLDAAKSQADTELAERRIAPFDKSYRFTEMLLALAQAETVDAAQADEIRRYAKEVLLPDPLTVFRWGTRPIEQAEAELMDRVDEAIGRLTEGKDR